MYGLPERFDASRLLGRTLEQVSFSANSIHLAFDHQVAITIEGRFAHGAKGEVDRATTERVPIQDSRLMQLLGQSVESAESPMAGTLMLIFTNGQSLSCYDDSPQYEAYRIRFGEDEIIV